MNFTIEILSGFCNVLKSLVTALSINENTNILPRRITHWSDGAAWDDLLDDNLICHDVSELGESFVSARFLILKEEEDEQPTLYNDARNCGDHPNIINTKLKPIFSTHSICIGFFDKSLICEKVFNRIQLGIQRVKWNNIILDEFNKIKPQLLNQGSLLTIQIRTWQNKQAGDRPDLITTFNDGVKRQYSFELYKNEIDKFLPKTKIIFLTIDREDLLPQYIDYLKDYKVVTYLKNDTCLTSLQHSGSRLIILILSFSSSSGSSGLFTKKAFSFLFKSSNCSLT